jgi:U3 small nucleolar RNA-associated protein 13
MVLELAFDLSSKFLAAGTADSHIKVFDVLKGFQTHNFIGGHRGIITNLTFFPEQDTLLLISSAEDCTIKVWDLVIRQERATLKGHQALVTSISFSADKSTLISSSKDGKLGFWNVKDNFKQLSLMKYSSQEPELNVAYYVQRETPFIIVGGATGALSVYDINKGKIAFTQSQGEFTANEITKILPFHKS